MTERRFTLGYESDGILYLAEWDRAETRAACDALSEHRTATNTVYELVDVATMDAVRAFVAAYPNRAIESLDALWRAIPEELRT